MTIQKPVRIHFAEEVYKEYEKLQKVVIEEKNKGITNSVNMGLLRAIDRETDNLKINPQHGVHIPRKKVPKELAKRYGTNNLWKINLPDAWRIIYSIEGKEVEIIALVLDIVDHKKYSKMFGYKK